MELTYVVSTVTYSYNDVFQDSNGILIHWELNINNYEKFLWGKVTIWKSFISKRECVIILLLCLVRYRNSRVRNNHVLFKVWICVNYF